MALAAKVEEFGWPVMFGRLAIAIVSSLLRYEWTKIVKFSSDMDRGCPHAPVFIPIRALQANTVMVGGSVGSILLGRGLSKIVPSVVQPISVDVVHKDFWPLSSHPEPRQPMSHVEHAIDADLPVMAVGGASNLANVSAFSATTSWALDAREPCEVPSLWVIVKNRAEVFRSYICSWGHKAQYDASMRHVKNAASGG